ncbi:MAG TPA: VOC family protein [Burkholderiales bacterium]|nr:VOC family protein [Burkholderiales bacterium]
MGVKLAKKAIDLGIVVRDKEAAVKFYRDTLGLEQIGEQGGSTGAVIVRLACGESQIKIWTGTSPKTVAASGGPTGGATGNRYWTISISNLDEMAAKIKGAGYKLAWEPREIRPGVRIAMAEDPDGNWVELSEAK